MLRRLFLIMCVSTPSILLRACPTCLSSLDEYTPPFFAQDISHPALHKRSASQPRNQPVVLSTENGDEPTPSSEPEQSPSQEELYKTEKRTVTPEQPQSQEEKTNHETNTSSSYPTQ